jgi:hypothetical protein
MDDVRWKRVRRTLFAMTLAVAIVTAIAPAATQSGTAAGSRHVIGVRVRNGAGELFDRRTGATFVVRGANYLRLSYATKDPTDALLDPSKPNLRGIRGDFGAMKALGFNTVRIFLDLCATDCIGDPNRLRPAYLDRLAAVVRAAKAAGLLVLPTVNMWDGLMGYRSLSPCCGKFNFNVLYLTSEGIKSASRFYVDLIRGLQRRKAPLDAVLAWELRNEQFYDRNHPPFSRSSGRVKTANGKTYDLADPAAKERMADDGLRYFIARVKAAIKKVDPSALVTMGFFNPQPADDPRLVRPGPLLTSSNLDFFDFHYYPGGRTSLAEAAQQFGMAGYRAKPIVLGEYGAFKFAYPSAEEGAAALTDLQVASCGFGFDGWLYWLWDERNPELWVGPESGGAINRAMSPRERPDPCAYGPRSVRNLAAGKPVRSSRSLPTNPPELAVDENAQTNWVSGEDAPQWIEVDLGAPSSITKIALAVSQFPEGKTVHRVWGRDADDAERLLYEFSGFTKEPEWLEVSPAQPWRDIRYVRIETAESPSWVAWWEIRVLGTAPG